MHATDLLIAYLFAFCAHAVPFGDHHSSGNGQPLICPGLNTQNSGCIRYTRGFDVTGVVTEIDLTFPRVRTECDCIQECLNRPGKCANYVYKFSTPYTVFPTGNQGGFPRAANQRDRTALPSDLVSLREGSTYGNQVKVPFCTVGLI